ncbi:SAC3/GANP/Nin1/mts3/eIF-3 p25 family-domain-containing protein [Lipomyces arxii]|uniref:SAC3/GANP/Nin1/mts3/eIF-3 p25 family-domain-containing protein n=1 Tax=Lipomyces arxii TaxID=56418 RepID=UPI0034CE54C3
MKPDAGKTSYSSVKVTKSLHKPKPEPSQSSGSSSMREWPESLKKYVGRCFHNADPAKRSAIESSLKEIITAEITAGTLWDVNWDTRVMPDGVEHTNIQTNMQTGTQTSTQTQTKAQIKIKTPTKKRGSKWDQSPVKTNKAEESRHEKKINTKNSIYDKNFVESQERKDKRARKYEQELRATPERSTPVYVEDTELQQFVGKSTKLEKKYFRLTAAPDPETVRPLHVLKQTLQLLRTKWSTDRNYAYICDQFKSMRQDLTVQLIQTEFTVNVYEIHARIALENGDLGEYNQCQSQLRNLYASGIPGHQTEFLAYRILYLLHTRNRSDMNDLMIELTDQEKIEPAVAHALKVRTAVEDFDYHALMKLYLTAPNMGGFVMDSFIERERTAAMEIISKAFRPDVPLRFLTDEIGFDSDSSCVEFLDKSSLSQFIDPDSLKFNTKNAYPVTGLRRSLRGDRNVSTTSSHHSISQKSPFTIIPPKKVIKALYDYNASSPGELSFNKGDFFHVIGNENDLNWYEACNPSTNMRGMVPVTYFQVLGRNERESLGSSIPTNTIITSQKKNSGISESSSSPATHSPTNRRSSGVMSSASSTSSGKVKSQPLYGIVQYNFVAERPDELDAYEGDTVIVVAQSNHEWFVAKPIGRLGGPGLIPISYVEIRDMTTGKTIENMDDAIMKAGVPRVEEWKKRTAEYKASSIPLGKFDDDDTIYSKFQSMSVTQQPQSQPDLFAPQQQQQQQQQQEQYSIAQSYGSYSPYGNRMSQRTSVTGYDPVVVSATVDKFAFDNGRYWYLLIAELEDGMFRTLCRFYEDFYDFQIRLLDEFPEEAGRTGRQRILPFIPGPVTFVNDSISSQRRVNLDEYVQKLIVLPQYISRSQLVRGLFAVRSGDIESHQPVLSLQQARIRDSRATANSGLSSTRSQRTDTGRGAYDQSSSRLSRSMAQKLSLDRLRSASSSQLARPVSGSTTTTSTSDVRASYVGSEVTRDVELERTESYQPTPQPTAVGNIKVKVFHQDDLIAIRVPADISFAQLEQKLQDRLGSSELVFYYMNEHTGQHHMLANDAELVAAVGNGAKLVLYTQ